MKKAKASAGRREFERAWKRIATQKDTWGVNYVYDHDGWKLWKAAVRAARRADSAGGGQ